MSRIVIKTAKKPFVLSPQAKPTTLCMCGLSKDQPFCDKSHLKTTDEQEDVVYQYDESGKRQIVGQGNCCGKCDKS